MYSSFSKHKIHPWKTPFCVAFQFCEIQLAMLHLCTATVSTQNNALVESLYQWYHFFVVVLCHVYIVHACMVVNVILLHSKLTIRLGVLLFTLKDPSPLLYTRVTLLHWCKFNIVILCFKTKVTFLIIIRIIYPLEWWVLVRRLLLEAKRYVPGSIHGD